MLDPQIVVALVGFIGLLVVQVFLHRRWVLEQDTKREQLIAQQDEKRQTDQAEILARMAEQNSAVVSNAVNLVEVHREDAETARLLAAETAKAHTECRSEVARLAGKVEELRARITESERTYGHNQALTERHRDLKHKTLNALTVSEGYVALVQKLLPTCTCHAFDPLEELTASVVPRIPELLAENAAILNLSHADPSKGA